MSRAGDLLRKIGRGGPKYICPWDGKDVSASMRAPYRASINDPNEHCGTAIQLDCGHWLLDDCDPKSGLNGMVLGIKDKREVPGETTGIKQLIQEGKDFLPLPQGNRAKDKITSLTLLIKILERPGLEPLPQEYTDYLKERIIGISLSQSRQSILKDLRKRLEFVRSKPNVFDFGYFIGIGESK